MLAAILRRNGRVTRLLPDARWRPRVHRRKGPVRAAFHTAMTPACCIGEPIEARTPPTFERFVATQL